MAEENVTLQKKRKGRVWTAVEEATLIEEVLAREDILFGDLKGVAAKSIGRRRVETWEAIAELISSRFCTAKRDVSEVKKKYFNMKQRAKAKIDLQRQSRNLTGGGPPPKEFTAAEEVLVASIGDRPVMSGLDGGMDTDRMSTTTVSDVPGSGTVGSAGSVECQQMSGSMIGLADFNLGEGKEKETSIKEAGSVTVTTGRKRKRHSLVEEETPRNIRLDSERLILEKEKILLETRRITMEMKLLQKTEEILKSIDSVCQVANTYYQQQLGFKISYVLDDKLVEP